MNNYLQDIWYHRLLVVSIILAFLLPHSMTPFLLVNPILCVCLYFFGGGMPRLSVKYFPLFFIAIALLVNLTADVSAKSMLSAITVLLYLFCFPWSKKIEINNKVIYFCFGFILTTQLIYLSRITFLINLMDTLYPINEFYEDSISNLKATVYLDNLSDFRLGGLYRNPNHCSKYVTFLISLYLCNNIQKSPRSNIPFIILSFFSVIMTGSRTGFIVFTLISGTYLLKTNYLRGGKRLIAALLVAGFLIWSFIKSSENEFRSLDMDAGSMTVKLETFLSYLANERSAFHLFFGYLDFGRYIAMPGVMANFDSEYGYLVFQYGIISFMALLCFYFIIFRSIRKEYRFALWTGLWMITSSLLCSYRASFIWLMFLAFLLSKSRDLSLRERNRITL